MSSGSGGVSVRPLKIAQIAPLYESVPPRLYGGTERVVAQLCDALVELGQDVTLFASADARTSAHLVPVRDQAIRLDAYPQKSDLAAHLTQLCMVKQRLSEFDVLHFHLDLLHFPLFEQHASSTVTTLHGRLDLKDLPAVFSRWRQFGLVSISEAQRQPLRDANWLANISHGLAASQFMPPAQPSGDYLAFLGRISPEKGPDIAIRLAMAAGIPLRMAAKIDAADLAYFNNTVKPLLSDPLVTFSGEIGDGDKAEFLGNARALLFPIDWPEPFGLVLIEAMACGTPVIAWDRGSVREIVEDGVTGFIVNSEQEALTAIKRLATLDRRRVRAGFERRFTAQTMARNYLRVYEQLLSRFPWVQPREWRRP